MNWGNVANAYHAQNDISKNKISEKQVTEANGTVSKKSDLGKTIGEPKLSEKAAEYYDKLKKKYGQYDFILVSSAEKENARANAGKYANGLKTVVLIDEEKIERMATDEKFRKQYEAILSGASKQINQIKATAQNAGTSLKGIVMQANDDGSMSFFAALKKSSDAQKARIEKKAEQKKAERKAEQKQEQKRAEQKRIEQRKTDRNEDVEGMQESDEDSEIITIMADSFDSLIKKIEEYGFAERSNNALSEGEKQIGQNIDFRG